MHLTFRFVLDHHPAYYLAAIDGTHEVGIYDPLILGMISFKQQ